MIKNREHAPLHSPYSFQLTQNPFKRRELTRTGIVHSTGDAPLVRFGGLNETKLGVTNFELIPVKTDLKGQPMGYKPNVIEEEFQLHGNIEVESR